MWMCLLAVMGALFITGTVFADDELPTETPAVAAETPAVEGSGDQASDPQEAITPDLQDSGGDESAPTDEVGVGENPTGAEGEGAAVDEETPAVEPEGGEAIIEEEDGTSGETEVGEPSTPAEVGDESQGNVVNTDETSASDEGSIQLTGGGDPYWKVGTQYYSVVSNESSCYGNSSVGGNTCWVITDDPISYALSKIEEGLLPTDKKLYVLSGTYTGSLNISGTYLSQLNGLIGVDGSESTIIIGDVTISDNTGGFTLSGFTITGSVYISGTVGSLVLQDLDVSGSSENGIYAQNQGNITVKNVKSHDNAGSGAVLDISYSGNVAISDSVFNANGGHGLSIDTPGTVSLNNVVASGNSIAGVYISDNANTSLKNVIANDNGDDGICVYTDGSLTMENITANGNDQMGIRATLETTGTATLKNLVASNNAYGGLYVYANSNVTVNNSQTNNNTGGEGLYIQTSGKVTLSTIRSSDNGENGLHIEGIKTEEEIWGEGEGWAVVSVACPTVTISSSASAAMANVFDGNGEAGVWIVTDKPVAISNFSASENGSNGVLVEGYWYYKLNPGTGYYDYTENYAGATTIKATIPNYTNKVNMNSGTVGLGIYSGSTVYLERTVANNNSEHGIEIYTYGAITLKNVKADGNISGCLLYNTDSVKAMAITLTNVEFSMNNTADYGGAGLDIHSKGNVTITNLVASNNADMGAGVINTAGTGKITLTKITLNANGANGLWADSNGVITLINVTANGNGDDGLKLSNDFTGYKAGIVLTSIEANNNNGNGILANTNGTLTVKDITACNNATLEGETWEGNTVQDFYNQDSGSDQWWFYASEGTTYTILLQADTDEPSNRSPFDPYMELFSEDGNSISGSVSSLENSYYQIVFTPGSGETGWYYVYASSYTNDGFYRLSVNNPDPTEETTSYYWVSGLNYNVAGNVTISGTNDFSNNSVAGVYGWSSGNVTASNITASDNGTEGILFKNETGSGNISLSGENTTDGNGWEGVLMGSNGTVSITNLNASNNGHDGIWIEVYTVGKAVTLKSITVLENDENGLTVKSGGNISLSNIRANKNRVSGIYLENTDGTGNIIVSGDNEACGNTEGMGIEVYSNGTVTISNLDASGNDQEGVHVEATGGKKAVTLNNVMANDNSAGFYVNALGTITLNSARAWQNTEDGAFLNSNGYALLVKSSSFMANGDDGLVYMEYPVETFPLFKFTNTGNIFLGNGGEDLVSVLH